MVGEAETRVADLLDDRRNRSRLPGVMRRDKVLGTPVTGGFPGQGFQPHPGVSTVRKVNDTRRPRASRPAGPGSLLRAAMPCRQV